MIARGKQQRCNIIIISRSWIWQGVLEKPSLLEGTVDGLHSPTHDQRKICQVVLEQEQLMPQPRKHRSFIWSIMLCTQHENWDQPSYPGMYLIVLLIKCINSINHNLSLHRYLSATTRRLYNNNVHIHPRKRVLLFLYFSSWFFGYSMLLIQVLIDRSGVAWMLNHLAYTTLFYWAQAIYQITASNDQVKL